ncbi:hypothetical protein QTL97_07305 [Sporosarcina thermotolerans]|uniref:Uncharacterized protein n=1 Tax=Sporosarcina thermotolerans TaxID=633404 RepID=A0AAW9A7Y8_9BACL|nr:hypothetical protein [Sporosarcina thermotolerans]MDW0116738.1 hypothetical protein [Sporosarcina thermotolerans]WHT48922.1 hypothetical protein QNH10_04245 [Sporosarcina thermotolerans]
MPKFLQKPQKYGKSNSSWFDWLKPCPRKASACSGNQHATDKKTKKSPSKIDEPSFIYKEIT